MTEAPGAAPVLSCCTYGLHFHRDGKADIMTWRIIIGELIWHHAATK